MLGVEGSGSSSVFGNNGFELGEGLLFSPGTMLEASASSPSNEYPEASLYNLLLHDVFTF
jgi:hypothetical protein